MQRGDYFFTLRVITPLFMGGAGQEPEIRTQSFNGVFRWWFRVAGGSRGDEKRIDEKRIFGWVGSDGANRGLVRLAFERNENNGQYTSALRIQNAVEAKNILSSPGVKYLGFSLFMNNRTGIDVGQPFTLKVSFSPLATEEDKKKFLAAMWLAFNLGNFGSRARRGFGSIVVEEVEGETYGLEFEPPEDVRRVEGWISENLRKVMNIFSNQNTNIKVFAFLRGNSRLLTGSYIQILNEIGMRYKNFRNGISRHRRILLGLPMGNIKPEIKIGDRWEKTRRASPVIFKILRTGNTHAALAITIESKFLPQHYKIIGIRLNNVNYNVIVDIPQIVDNMRVLNLRRIYP